MPPEIIFVFGVPRSGTTLVLGTMIREQSKTCGSFYLESGIFSSLFQEPFELSSFLNSKYLQEVLSVGEIQALFERSTDFVDYFNQMVTHLLQKYGAEVFVEKTPYHTLLWREIRRCFPESGIILIQRNPIANIHSMVTARWIKIPSDRFLFGLHRIVWLKYLSASFVFYRYQSACQEIANAENVVVLKYEDLVMDEKTISEKIEEHFQLRLDPLSIPRPHSAEVQHREGGMDKSRVDGYKSKVPKSVQWYLKMVFIPENMAEKCLSGCVLRLVYFPVMFLSDRMFGKLRSVKQAIRRPAGAALQGSMQ